MALDEGGRPSFNSLQNYASAGAPLHFFIFDVLILKGKDVMSDPLMKRRELIEEHILPMLAETIRYSPILHATPISCEDVPRQIKTDFRVVR